ncbi:MAG: hypothetical protein PHH90_02105 [Limnochordia bacterium]|nr:hypothetical protein [Limnochordia bacterium]
MQYLRVFAVVRMVLGLPSTVCAQSYIYADAETTISWLTKTIESPQELSDILHWLFHRFSSDDVLLSLCPVNASLELQILAKTSASSVSLEVPLPADSRLLAILRSVGQGYLVETMAFYTPWSPSKVAEFYQMGLVESGWSPVYNLRHTDGMIPRRVLSFVKGSEGRYIMIDEGIDPLTFVQLVCYRVVTSQYDAVFKGGMSHAQ